MILADSPVIEIAAGTVDDSEAQEVYRNLQVLYGTHTGEQALDRDFGIDICTKERRAILSVQSCTGARVAWRPPKHLQPYRPPAGKTAAVRCHKQPGKEENRTWRFLPTNS